MNNMIKYAKENFIHKIDDILGNPEIGNSSKRFMQVMGRFMGKTGTSINIPPLHIQDNTLACSDFEKAQELNSYFASISTIEDTNTDLPYFEKRCNVDFTQIRITVTISTLDKQRICVNTLLKSSKKAIIMKCVRTEKQF